MADVLHTIFTVFKAAREKNLISDEIHVFLAGTQVDGRHRSLQQDLHLFSEDEPPVIDGLNFRSVLCYIYTSGTTGNPKPAVIKHFRYFWIAMGAGKAFGINKSDVVYITMPMYHSAAGIMGIGSLIAFGSTAVIRKKFSASNFWKDCVKYNVTATQYIGEICRYQEDVMEVVLELHSGIFWQRIHVLKRNNTTCD